MARSRCQMSSLSTLSIVCEPCNRHGRYSVARLVEEYGDAKLTNLLEMLDNSPKDTIPQHP